MDVYFRARPGRFAVFLFFSLPKIGYHKTQCASATCYTIGHSEKRPWKFGLDILRSENIKLFACACSTNRSRGAYKGALKHVKLFLMYCTPKLTGRSTSVLFRDLCPPDPTYDVKTTLKKATCNLCTRIERMVGDGNTQFWNIFGCSSVKSVTYLCSGRLHRPYALEQGVLTHIVEKWLQLWKATIQVFVYVPVQAGSKNKENELDKEP